MDVCRLLAWRKDNIYSWKFWVAFGSIILHPIMSIKLDLSILLSNEQCWFGKLKATVMFKDVLSSLGCFILVGDTVTEGKWA